MKGLIIFVLLLPAVTLSPSSYEVDCFDCSPHDNEDCPDDSTCSGPSCYYIRGQETATGMTVVRSGCLISKSSSSNGCSAGSIAGITGTLCVCNKALCNNEAYWSDPTHFGNSKSFRCIGCMYLVLFTVAASFLTRQLF